MSKIQVYIYFLFFLQFGTSQKLVEKTVLNPSTKYVQIDGNKCFHLVLNTHQSDLLKVEASLEGEYAKELVIKLEEDGDNIGISAGLLPSFKAPNDKLSVHKVISIVLRITLPQYMAVSAYGTNTNVIAEGQYRDLSVTLVDGSCTLNNISEKVKVKTLTGEILLTNAKGMVTVETRYGKVEKGYVPKGNHTYLLQSVEGAITVNKNNG